MVIQFDKSFKTFGTWENKKGKKWNNEKSGEGEGIGAYLEFKKGATVQAKIASSYISKEQAQITLENELGKHRNLEKTKKIAGDVWNKQLGKIVVEGGAEE